MRKSKNKATASNLVKTVKEEAGEVQVDAANVAKKAASKAQGTVRGKKKKAAKKEILKPEVIIQYVGNAAQLEEIIEKIKRLYVEEGHYLASLKSLQVYVKPEENAAYYVINKKKKGKIDLF